MLILNAIHLTTNLKYVQTKYTTHRGGDNRPAKQVDMTNCPGMLT